MIIREAGYYPRNRDLDIRMKNGLKQCQIDVTSSGDTHHLPLQRLWQHEVCLSKHPDCYQRSRILSVEWQPWYPSEKQLRTGSDWCNFILKCSPSSAKALTANNAADLTFQSLLERWEAICGMADLMSEWNTASNVIRLDSLHLLMLTVLCKYFESIQYGFLNAWIVVREAEYYLWKSILHIQMKLGFKCDYSGVTSS